MSDTCNCGCSCSASHSPSHDHHPVWRRYLPLVFSVAIFLLALLLPIPLPLSLLLYGVAYLPLALPVAQGAWNLVRYERMWANELSLMLMATIGAFVIGEYAEGVLLMILYTVGELLQERAVDRARKSIASLLDVRPAAVRKLLPNGSEELVSPASLAVGDKVRLHVGDRLPVDAVLRSGAGTVDYAALTGETLPVDLAQDEQVMAGAVVLGQPMEVEVALPYSESTLAKILHLVEEAAERKSPTEQWIRRFARHYTPIVTGIALLIVLLPYLYSLLAPSFVYHWETWLYRGLVFLVTSCPCALIISVPLTYFAGIGSASRQGLLFKGGTYLDTLRHVDTFLLDKTGTVTQGSFCVSQVISANEGDLLPMATLAAMEQQSSHPIARAIVAHMNSYALPPVSLTGLTEEVGKGLRARNTKGEILLVGGENLMRTEGVTSLPMGLPAHSTPIHLAIDGAWALTLLLTDQVKPEATSALHALRGKRVRNLYILSGDRPEVVGHVAALVGADDGVGGCLPHDKLRYVEDLQASGRTVAFVGDGFNDAPVMALSDVSFAMGGIGSQATIEAADVVIQSDQLSLLPRAVEIARRTGRIVVQNIAFALAFKALIMLLALFGYAHLTLAIVADVGVSLLTVLNALRNFQKG